jgi:methylene-tetrahydromethanopterin dehydrogenase
MSVQEGILVRSPQRRSTNIDLRPKKKKKAKTAPLTAPQKRVSKGTPVLYMLSPQKYMSPFDINMAVDSGYKVILPYDNVALGDVRGLVQDAMFSRPPQLAARTGFFIGGKDIDLALEMIRAAKIAMMPPFQISVFADPGGSFTTAGSLVACIERALRRNFKRPLVGTKISVFGATGVVGFASSVLAAQSGAHVRMVGHESLEPLKALAGTAQESFGAHLDCVAGFTEPAKARIVQESDVVISAGPAGVGIISGVQIARAANLLVAADVNAVAPAGVEGMELHMDGAPLPGSSALGVGPLAIGDIKYKVQAALLKRMLRTDKALDLDFRQAFQVARRLTSDNADAPDQAPV